MFRGLLKLANIFVRHANGYPYRVINLDTNAFSSDTFFEDPKEAISYLLGLNSGFLNFDGFSFLKKNNDNIETVKFIDINPGSYYSENYIKFVKSLRSFNIS